MRKATKVLLIISEVFGFVGFGFFLVYGLVSVLLAADPQSLLEALVKSGTTGININTVKETYVPVFTAVGIIFLVCACFALPTAILCVSCRKELKRGSTKALMKPKAICMIIFGAIGCDIALVPAIFMLAMNESNFQPSDEEK